MQKINKLIMTNINMGTNYMMIIVGLISSFEEKDEIEEVIKIFSLGKRMRDLTKQYKLNYKKEIK